MTTEQRPYTKPLDPFAAAHNAKYPWQTVITVCDSTTFILPFWRKAIIEFCDHVASSACASPEEAIISFRHHWLRVDGDKVLMGRRAGCEAYFQCAPPFAALGDKVCIVPNQTSLVLSAMRILAGNNDPTLLVIVEPDGYCLSLWHSHENGLEGSYDRIGW